MTTGETTTATPRWEVAGGGPPRVPEDGGNGFGGNGHGPGGDGHARPNPPNAQFAVILAMIASTMLFAALVGGMIVLRAGVDDWPPPDSPPLWPVLRVSTLLIVASSLTLILTHWGMARDQLKLARNGLLVTSLLGVGFVASQVAAWNQLQTDGFLPSSHNFGGMFYLLSLLHGLHVFGGIVLLLAATARTARVDGADEDQRKRLKPFVGAAGAFWHFIDVTWIVILGVLAL